MKTISYNILSIDHINKRAFLKISKDQKSHFHIFRWHNEPTIVEAMQCIFSSQWKLKSFIKNCKEL